MFTSHSKSPKESPRLPTGRAYKILVGICSVVVTAAIGYSIVWAANTLPVASEVSISSGAASITLNEGTTIDVICTATVTDDNGYTNITTTTAKLYLTSVGAEAADDNDNHYTLSGARDAYCTSTGENTGNCTTTFSLYYYADPGEWTCQITPFDSEGAGTAATDTITMNETQYLNVSATISYGSVNAGATSTGDHTATVTNTGNIAIDVKISGTAMSCNIRGSIATSSQQYATSIFSYDSGTPLSATATDWNLDLPTPEDTNVPVTDDTYWQVSIPTRVEGTCSGTNTFEVRTAL